MKLDKKQIPQLVVLGLLVIICIGYVSFTVMKPPATESAPQAKTTAKANIAGKAIVAIQPQMVSATTTFPDLNAPLPRRDPFAMQAMGDTSDSKTTKPVKTTNFRLAPNAERIAKVASSKVPPLMPFGNFGATPKISVVPSMDQDPEFTLTGVIRGEENVAIIRVGNSERHVVKQGQFIDGRYRVLFVTEDGAVLACKDRRIHLRLGGVRNAS